jgi:hypothetical protein
MKIIYKVMSIFMILILASNIVTVPANAVSVSWKSNGSNFWSIDQSMWIEKMAPLTFWAMEWWWTKGGTGYLGLQTTSSINSAKSKSITGKALFSIWDATAAKGKDCGTFSGEGVGYHCFANFSLRTNTVYTYKLARLNNDGIGQWWGAWIDSDSASTYIGAIRTNSAFTEMGTPIDWTEYFGGGNASLKSIVDWTPPMFNYIGRYRGLVKTYQYYSQFDQIGGDNNGIIIPQTSILRNKIDRRKY